MEMTQVIQGFKLPHNLTSMDFNSKCTHFATGGKQNIMIVSLGRSNDCWFKKEKIYGRYRGTSQTKANVTQLAWNKEGKELLAIGTSTGLVIVYDTEAPYRNILQTKGHQGDIKNVQWHPGSPEQFVSSCFDNEILQWDIRSEKPAKRYEFGESIKIRDLRFNPHRPHYIAVQSSRKLQLIDTRKGNEIVAAYEIQSNQLHGIGVKWDPNNPHKVASAISKEIKVFDISSSTFQETDGLSHYALIKNFHWMKTKPTFFGIMCDKPEKNIFFYDIEDKNRLAYYYGGHQRPIDCWIMDQQETILVSASTQKEKAARGAHINPNSGLLVAQYTSNYFDPNDSKFNHPLAFNNDSQIAFCLNLQSSARKGSNAQVRKKNKPSQSNPSIYQFRDTVQWFQRDKQLFPLSLKEQLLYLAKNYILEGSVQKISQNNSEVAARIGKSYSAEMWRNIFLICSPQEEEPTIEMIFQRKMKVNTSIIDNRVIYHGSRQQNTRSVSKIDVTSMLQWLVDEHNELQTAALASVCLLSHCPDLVSDQFVDKVWNPYIELLRSMELYELASESILLTKKEKYTKITEMDTKYNLTCGSCNLSVSKGQCKCNLLCVICRERLNKKMVIWCKYCGHGGHAVEYEKWFKVDKKRFCPHGCGHECFSTSS